MKRILVLLVLGLGLSASVFAGLTYDAYCVFVGELADFTNGCGPGELQDSLREILNDLSGNVGACDQHDWDYYTLGVSKAEADKRFYAALQFDRLGELGKYQPEIAAIYYRFVQLLGDESYQSAQMVAREAFRNIHHGYDWLTLQVYQIIGGPWGPPWKHIPMIFPECTSDCIS